MPCSVPLEIRMKYPKTLEMVMISASGEEITPGGAGYYEELERLGSATLEPKRHKLRALGNIKDLYNAGNVYLEKIEFWAIDTVKPGSTHQDADTIAAIASSRTNSKAYAQSAFLNAILPVNFQPNYFRPSVQIDGLPILGGMDAQNNNVADMGIGLNVTTCVSFDRPLGTVKDFQIISKCAQYISETNKYQNYAVMAKATFWIGDQRAE